MSGIFSCKSCFKSFLSNFALQKHISSQNGCMYEMRRNINKTLLCTTHEGGLICLVCNHYEINNKKMLKHLNDHTRVNSMRKRKRSIVKEDENVLYFDENSVINTCSSNFDFHKESQMFSLGLYI